MADVQWERVRRLETNVSDDGMTVAEPECITTVGEDGLKSVWLPTVNLPGHGTMLIGESGQPPRGFATADEAKQYAQGLVDRRNERERKRIDGSSTAG